MKMKEGFLKGPYNRCKASHVPQFFFLFCFFNYQIIRVEFKKNRN